MALSAPGSTQVHFSDCEPLAPIVQLKIAQARREIVVLQAFVSTRYFDVSIRDAVRRGVRVRVCSNRSSLEGLTRIAAIGGEARVYRSDGTSFLHHKIVVVDEHVVLFGSLNWHDGSLFSDQENLFIADAADLVGQILEVFEQVWQGSNPVPADQTPKRSSRRAILKAALAVGTLALIIVDLILVWAAIS